MSCSDVLDLIEPIAAGDLRADEAVRAHLQSCVDVRGRTGVRAAARVRAERDGDPAGAGGVHVDGAAAHPARSLAVGAERRPALQRGDGCGRPADGWRRRGDAERRRGAGAHRFGAGRCSGKGCRRAVQDAAPTLATYVAAAGLLASALGMWWWAETAGLSVAELGIYAAPSREALLERLDAVVAGPAASRSPPSPESTRAAVSSGTARSARSRPSARACRGPRVWRLAYSPATSSRRAAGTSAQQAELRAAQLAHQPDRSSSSTAPIGPSSSRTVGGMRLYVGEPDRASRRRRVPAARRARRRSRRRRDTCRP